MPKVLIDQVNKSYFQYYQDAVQFFSKVVPPVSSNTNDNGSLLQNDQFVSFMGIFPGVVGIIDLRYMNYVYLSDNIKNIMGYEPKEFYEKGLEKVVTLFPKEQVNIILQKIFPSIFSCFNEYSTTNEAKKIQASFTSYVIRSNGSIGSFLHQMSVIHTDDLNKPVLALKLMTDISDIKKDNGIYLKIAKQDELGIYQPIITENFLIGQHQELLSSRETQVLNLISQGKSSAQIGDALCITEETVYKHRKNMLKKMHAKTTGELLSKAITHGII